MIKVRDLHKSFGRQKVLGGVDLDIEEGSTIAIVGPSGVGKSVMLKIITGLIEADSGEVAIDGDVITAAHSSKEKLEICRRMGVLFQGAALFDSMNLIENVSFPLSYREGLSRKEAYEQAYTYLCAVGLSGYELRLPGEVSIGIRKRVGIARALVTEPEIVLFDEPNTGLDPETGQEIYELMNKVQEESNFTGIVISHEIPEVFQVCERVAMLYDGDFVFKGTISEFTASDNPVVRQFQNGDINGPISVE